MGSKIEKRIDIKVTQTGVKELKDTSRLINSLLTNISKVTDKTEKLNTSLIKSLSALRQQAIQFRDSTKDINKYQTSLNKAATTYEKLAKQKLPEITPLKKQQAQTSTTVPQSNKTNQNTEENYFTSRNFASLFNVKPNINQSLADNLKQQLAAIKWDIAQNKNYLNRTTSDAKAVARRKKIIRAGEQEQKRIERELAAIRNQYQQEALEKETAVIQKKYEMQDFWSQRVWQSQNPVTAIVDKFNPAALLKNYIGTQREKSSKLKSTAKMYQNYAQTKQMDIAAKKAAGEEVSQAEVAEVAQAAKAAQSSEAASGAASSAASAASGMLIVVAGIAKIAKQFLAGWKATTRAVTGMSFSVKDNFQDVVQNVSKITDMYSGMATYAANNSLIMNASARETQLKYGLTGAQAYAFDKTRDLLGIKSDEDLAYMNVSQRAVFQAYLQKQEAWYSRLEQSGVLQNIQELQLDFAMFKEELAVEFLSWIADNKDTIMSVLKMSLTVLKSLLTGVMNLLSFFHADVSGMGFDTGASELSDIVGGSKISMSQNRSVNVNATFNASGVISDQAAMQAWYDNMTRQTMRDAGLQINGGA